MEYVIKKYVRGCDKRYIIKYKYKYLPFLWFTVGYPTTFYSRKSAQNEIDSLKSYALCCTEAKKWLQE